MENTSLILLSALSTFVVVSVTLRAFDGNQNLWSTSTAVQSNAAVALAPVHIEQQAMTHQAVGVRGPDAGVEEIVTQGSADIPSSKFSFVQGAMLVTIGLCAAAWARIRNINKPHPWDVEEGMAMVSTAADAEVNYYFLVANAKFMLFDEEHAMELLREKRRFLREKGIPQDFWIVPNPEFLDQFPDLDKKVLKPCAALVSTDERWITFMKLRYDKVLMGSFTGSSDIKKALATKGGDALAVLPKWELPKDWEKTVPYPKYADDWFHPFLVTPPSA